MASAKTIGKITTYHGSDHPYLKKYRVKIIAVIDGGYLTSEEDIARRGGIKADDRIEVVPYLPEHDRYGFASSDVRARDLACYSREFAREKYSSVIESESLSSLDADIDNAIQTSIEERGQIVGLFDPTGVGLRKISKNLAEHEILADDGSVLCIGFDSEGCGWRVAVYS